MIVGVCRLSLFFSESGSLKAKRHGLRKIIDRTRAKFNVAVAEVADQDTWQRAKLGFAVVGNDQRHVQSMLDNVVSFVDHMYVAQILDCDQDVQNYGDEESTFAGDEDEFFK